MNIQNNKIIQTLMCFFLINTTFAQGVAELAENPILYREYNNIVQLGFTKGFEETKIEVENASWLQKSNGELIVTPTKEARFCNIKVISQNKDTSIFIFLCSNLPQPRIYWGVTNNDNIAAAEETFLFVKYDETAPIHHDFQITNWRVKIGNKTIRGKGNKLSSSIRDLVYAQPTSDVLVNISVDYTSSFNTTGKLNSSFHVINYAFRESNPDGFVHVIDQDSTNAIIFDENDPFSLISQIHSTNLWGNLTGMSHFTADRLIREGNDSLEFLFPFWPNVIKATSHGHDSLVEALDDGTMAYSYHSIPNNYFDLSNISRLLLYVNTHVDPISQQKVTAISHVGLAKRYGNSAKYDVVAKIPFSQLSLCYGLGAVYKESSDSSLRILLSEVNRTQTKESKISSYSQGTDFAYFDKYCTLPNFPMKWLKPYSEESFDSIFYYVEQSDIPLFNVLGDDSIKVNTDGTNEVIYPIDTVIYRAYVNPADLNAFLGYEMVTEPYSAPKLVVTHVVFTIKKSGEDFGFCTINLDKLPFELRNIYFPEKEAISISDLPWKHVLRKEIEKTKSYSLASKKDIKLLGKEFHLDTHMGLPVNLLGVCDKK